MQIITRSHLKAFLTDPSMDPEQELTTEMTAFADGILADSPYAQYFVFTDNENGDDPEVGYDEFAPVVSRVVVPQADADCGYYGMDVKCSQYNLGNPTKVYGCYLGGSTGASATGFVITTAELVG